MNQPRFVAVEGPIAVGKTDLANGLARRLRARTVLENVAENPFLASFYRDMRAHSFQTQIFFLLSRYKQMREIAQADLFYERVISDYIFAKDRIFAYLNLDDEELSLYEKIYPFFESEIMLPDLVIYLQASPEHIFERMKKRDRPYERPISIEYTRELTEAYNRFFFHYASTPLLVVNANALDFSRDEEAVKDLMKQLEKPFAGTRYYVPPAAGSPS
ncbi:MAG: deoxynucleoside kinase [Thermoplasmata archaeon]